MSAMTPDQPELDLDRIENHVGSQPYSVVLALLARLRAAEARVAELEATNERLLSSDPSEVCAAWRDGFTSGVLGEKPPHGTTHVTRLGRIAELEAALGEACDIADASVCVGPTRDEQARIDELRKLVKP